MSLEDVKEGDLVIKTGSGAMRQRSILKVARITKTQVVCKSKYGEEKFRKIDGNGVGSRDSCYRTWIRKGTTEEIESIQTEHLKLVALRFYSFRVWIKLARGLFQRWPIFCEKTSTGRRKPHERAHERAVVHHR